MGAGITGDSSILVSLSPRLTVARDAFGGNDRCVRSVCVCVPLGVPDPTSYVDRAVEKLDSRAA